MGRSIWKVPFAERFFWRAGRKRYLFDDVPKVWSSRLLVFRRFAGRRLSVYNGSRFFPILVKRRMVGSRLGEFRVTKVISGNLKIHRRQKRARKLSKGMKRQ